MKKFLHRKSMMLFHPPQQKAQGLFSGLLTLAFLAFAAVGFGQSTANYAFATNTTGSLALDQNANAIDMTTGTTQLVAAGTDDGASAVTNIGFDFWLNGGRFAQFSASSNGLMALGATAVTTVYVTTGGTPTNPHLAAFNADLRTGLTTGKVHFKTVGTAPNRTLVVEFREMQVFYTLTSTTGTSTYQVRLYETTNNVELVYGTMSATDVTATSRAPHIGFYTGSTTGTFASVLYATQTSSTTAPFAANPNVAAVGPITELTSGADGSRRFYAYSATGPIAPTPLPVTGISGTGMTVNWTDNSADEIGFAIYRSTDNVNFTYVSTTAANVATSAQTGLVFGTLYYWRVYAVKEVLSTPASSSGTTTAGTLSGIKLIPGDYTNLTTAFAAINASGLSGNIELQLTTGYPAAAEIFPIASSNASAVGAFTVKVYPNVASLTITGTSATGLINLNNGTNITFDGRVNQAGAKNLVISNTNTGTGAYAIQFINDAVGNTVKYCTVKSLNPSATSGVIVFSTAATGTTGNDNNTIDNCDIDGGAAAVASPTLVAQNGIYASGTTTSVALHNSGNTISNCNIFNNFVTTATNAGILILTGNTDWTINANSFYQTNTRTALGATTIYGISIANSTSGNNFIVTNNFVGGNTSSAGGTAYTVTGAFANRFNGIGLSVGTTTASSVQGNTIANFSFASTSSASANSTSAPLGTGVWGGIYVGAGSANIGTTTFNTVGSGTGTGSIAVTVSTNSGATANGIGVSGSGIVNISNNKVGSITTNGGAATISTGIIGILSNATGTVTINLNTIGSTATANSLNASLASTGTTAQVVLGISNTGAATAMSITNNTIANLNDAYLPSAANTGRIMAGIASSSGLNTITGNTIRNLSAVANATGTTTSASVIGISLTSTTAGTNVSQNTIYAMANTHASAAVLVTGIIYSGATSGTNVVSRNLIYGINGAAANAAAVTSGIQVAAGTTTYHNNMVRLGLDAAGAAITAGAVFNGINEPLGTDNFYFNSVYIGGTGVLGANATYAFNSQQVVNTRIFKNNIFVNARSNGAGTGKHYAVRVGGSAPNPGGLSINNNDYFVSGTGGVFGFFNALDVANLAAWKTAVGQDAVSLSVDPVFIDPTASTPNLHVTSGTTVLESAGETIAAVAVDFDGQTRPGTPSGSNNGFGPDLGADEFDGINPDACMGTPASGGTATAAVSSYCNSAASANIAFTLTGATAGAGIQYQWQTSDVGANTWSNVAGATSSTATITITGAKDVRCLVTCLPSGMATTSNTVTITTFTCQFEVVRTTPVTYTSISGTGTGVSAWNGTGSDDNSSSLINIGFTFPYKGQPITQVSLSTNGVLSLGAVATTSFNNNLNGFNNIITPFWDDWVVQGNPGTAGNANFIKTQLDGTAPTRVFTAEWIGMEQFNYGGPNINFQVKLYESTGVIEFNYGTADVFNGTAPTTSGQTYPTLITYSIGTSGPSGLTGVEKTQSLLAENVVAFNATDPLTLALSPECNTRYQFTPGAYTGSTTAPGASAPSNDNSAGAVTLSVNPVSCTSFCGTNYTTKNATASSETSSCSVAPDDDVWFKFVATTASQIITVRGAVGFDAVVSLLDASFVEVSPFGCVDATIGVTPQWGQTETITATGLTETNTYYVRVSHKGTGSGSPTGFSICVNEVAVPPTNDNPCGAHALTISSTCTPYSDNTSDRKTAFITATTTTSNGVTSPTCTGAGVNVNDVWFSFVAPASGGVNIDIAPISGVNPAVQLYSVNTGTSCPTTLALTSVGCVNGGGSGVTEQVVASTLTVGATYYIRVYQHPSGTGGTPVMNSQFSICVYAPLPACPATFTPANAATICASATATTLSWTAGTNATGYDVYFELGTGPATFLASANQVGLTYNAGILAPGTYSWRIEPKNGNGTTSSCTNQTFTVIASPITNITPAGPITLCAPNTQVLTLGATDAATPTYQWQLNAANISGENATSYTAPTSGSYRLVVTDGVTTCSGASNAVVVTINPVPDGLAVTPATATVNCGSVQAITASENLLAKDYIFTAPANVPGTFVALTSSTAVDVIEDDDVVSGALPIGFSFKFEGTSYTDVRASSNGWLSFNPLAGSVNSGVGNATTADVTNLPLLAPLWDDLDGTDAPGSASYKTEGTAPNRVFTMEWLNWEWNFTTDVAVISYQVKLFETTNKVEFHYKQEAGATSATPTASIGLMTSSTNYLMLDGTGATPLASNTVFTTTLATKPATDQIYRFERPVPTYLWAPVTELFTDIAATVPYVAQNVAVVYTKPTANRTYTVTSTNAGGCTATASSVITLGVACGAVNAKFYLTNVSGGSMDNYLGVTMLIPTTDPYSAAPYSTGGNFTYVPTQTPATTTQSIIDAQNVVDWVFVELRTGTSGATTVAASKSGLLKNTGGIINPDGTPFSFSGLSAGNYFIAIKHRNHAGFMTGVTKVVPTPSLVDFTIAGETYYEPNHPALELKSPGVYAMWTGDATLDTTVDGGDVNFDRAISGSIVDEYHQGDMNLDGSVDGGDVNAIRPNSGTIGQQID